MKINIIGHSNQFISTNIVSDETNEIIASQEYISKSIESSLYLNIRNLKHGGSVSAIEPHTDFFASIYNNDRPLSKSTGIMPPGLLYANNNYIIYERPPSYQLVQLIPRQMDEISYKRDEIYTYNLPIPWQVYVVKYETLNDNEFFTDSVKMYFTSGPIHSFDENVYLPPLTNFYLNSELCRPMYSSINDIERYTKDIAGVIASSYDWVWNSGFNFDLTNCIVHFINQMKGREQETILQKAAAKQSSVPESIYSNYHITSYYAHFSHADYLYKEWEKYDLDEIIELKWPNPLPNKSLTYCIEEEYSNALLEYLRSKPENFNRDYFHYDEDNDDYYQCEDPSCECNGGGEYNMLDFLKKSNLYPTPPISLFDEFLKFQKNTSFPFSKIKTNYFHWMASSIKDAIDLT